MVAGATSSRTRRAAESASAGIPAAIQDKLFYPLVTGRAEGTGLGLSIAQSVINQHGGLIECDSRPGETRFSILIPMEIEE